VDADPEVFRMESFHAAAELIARLRLIAAGDAATPQDIQLLAALDRWATGDLT
jgi:hypothetical protein